MKYDWEKRHIERECCDNSTGIAGILRIEKHPDDIVMDEGFILHKEEVILDYGKGTLFLGNKHTFSRRYEINSKGDIFSLN